MDSNKLYTLAERSEYEVGVDLSVSREAGADDLAIIMAGIQQAITAHLERPDTQAALNLAGVVVLGSFGEKA